MVLSNRRALPQCRSIRGSFTFRVRARTPLLAGVAAAEATAPNAHPKRYASRREHYDGKVDAYISDPFERSS